MCQRTADRAREAPLRSILAAVVLTAPDQKLAGDLDPLEQHLVDALGALAASAERAPELPEAAALWRAQVDSRLCDHAAR